MRKILSIIIFGVLTPETKTNEHVLRFFLNKSNFCEFHKLIEHAPRRKTKLLSHNFKENLSK
jgi:hypothetical protein